MFCNNPKDFFGRAPDEPSFLSRLDASRKFYNPVDILLVEDNHGDELLTRKSIVSTKVAHKLHVIDNGNDVLPHLRRCRKLGLHHMPDILMLDLGLPGTDGFDVLAELGRAPASIRGVPVVILTEYNEFKYFCGNYDLCFMAYLAKPCNTEVMAEMLAAMCCNKNLL